MIGVILWSLTQGRGIDQSNKKVRPADLPFKSWATQAGRIDVLRLPHHVFDAGLPSVVLAVFTLHHELCS
ncbi:hypothetical protein [Octadecabacter antarcticus]|uniref:hypothetical protein n=1 Tax=Octadecabacter antarcticus TaxID=1217908 RepID=UPI0002F0468D|nr:hypothetical protein [Octadecabacter antarcticus]